MYFGSCLRDNALAAGVKAQGHDILLIPIYTPTLPDEPNLSAGKILFGGISVYLKKHYWLFRHMPRFLERVWDSPAALKLAARGSISTSPKLLGEMTVSMLRGEAGFLRTEFQKMADWLRAETAPEIVTLPNSLLLGLARPI